MKLSKIALLNLILLTNLPIFGLEKETDSTSMPQRSVTKATAKLAKGDIAGALDAFGFPAPPTPLQVLGRIKTTWQDFSTTLKNDLDLMFKKGKGPEVDQRLQELDAFAGRQVLNGGHMWLPLMNMSDNTLVQIMVPPPFPPPIAPLLSIPFIQGQIGVQMMRYNIRLLTPLEFLTFSRQVVFDAALLQGLINFIPESAKIGEKPARQVLTKITTDAAIFAVNVSAQAIQEAGPVILEISLKIAVELTVALIAALLSGL